MKEWSNYSFDPLIYNKSAFESVKLVIIKPKSLLNPEYPAYPITQIKPDRLSEALGGKNIWTPEGQARFAELSEEQKASLQDELDNTAF